MRTLLDVRSEEWYGLETAVAGREGAFGLLTVVGRDVGRCQVQIGGRTLIMAAERFAALFNASEAVRRVALLYIDTVMFQNLQAVACNWVHSVSARLSRWLLTMHDRVVGDLLPFTHEYVAPILGVNRSTLSLAAAARQRQGAIAYRRGDVRIVDRRRLEQTSCECYFNARRRYERLRRQDPPWPVVLPTDSDAGCL